MGNHSSLIRKSQKDSSKRAPTNRLADSDDDNDETDDIPSNSIQLEVETYECLSGQTESEVINCLANSCESDHQKYILVEDLFKNNDKNASLQILPEAIRHESVLEYIKILEKLVVRIRTSVRGKTGEKLSFATGCVELTSDTLVKNGNCRLRNCKYNKGQIHENYGGLVVYTNNHVIKNNSEADCCNVDFFYYNDKSLVDVDVMTDGGSSRLENRVKISPAAEVDNSEQLVVGSSLLESNVAVSSLVKVDQNVQLDIGRSCLDSNDDINSSGKDSQIEMTDMEMGPEITASGSLPIFSGDCSHLSSEVVTSEYECGNNEEGHNNYYSDHLINMYRSRLHRGITAYGSCLRENQKNKDLVGLRIFYHDPELFNLIKTMSSLRMNAISKIPEEIKQKMKKYAIVISHPHGWPKRISFGDLVSLEETYRSQQGFKMTKYNATTCGGSSGAPVVTGNYSYRPFVHTGKDKVTKLGLSCSY
ncbi:unnamed protein product [Candidula unifasciata]|uniref:Serine protease n=1 Tax=Candidula unifasciata TaxID=100452 RepID=A0A8S3ZVC4_9EUPU|nr:unnamed protein product [Candidula unifasciata]